jgi:hypothetical protein
MNHDSYSIFTSPVVKAYGNGNLASALRAAAGVFFTDDSAQECHDRLIQIAAELEDAHTSPTARIES